MQFQAVVSDLLSFATSCAKAWKHGRRRQIGAKFADFRPSKCRWWWGHALICVIKLHHIATSWQESRWASLYFVKQLKRSGLTSKLFSLLHRSHKTSSWILCPSMALCSNKISNSTTWSYAEASHTNFSKFLARDAVHISAICCGFELASQSQRR